MRKHSLLLLSLSFSFGVSAQGTAPQLGPSAAAGQSAGQVADVQTGQSGGLTDDQIKAIRDKCNFRPEETDPKKINASVACIQKTVLAVRRKQQAEAALQSLKTGEQRFVQTIRRSPPANQTPSVPGSLVSGSHVGGSNNGTPSACGQGSGFNNPDIIGVRRELLAPKEASDVYGHRLGRRYFVYQVRVTNLSKDFQYIVHDISLDLGSALGEDPDQLKYLASSRDLALLRGVPEKGQDLDPRNLTLHVLQGIGSVAGGVSGLTDFSDTMGSAVAVFNGAFLQAFVGIARDHTATQLNRLSDTAFASNTVVDKLHTKVFAVFVPEALLISKKAQNQYWKNPLDLLGTQPFDKVDVCVDGALVTEVPATTSPVFLPDPGTESEPATAAKVTLSDVDTTAVIYYTANGDVPTTASTKYTAPIPITAKTTINAMALAPNHTPSPVLTGTYQPPH